MDAASLRSRHRVADAAAERMLRLPVKNGHLVVGGEQPLHQKFANEQRPADYENAHRIIAPVWPALMPVC